jgi:metal-sulfur cluster biosynthetic enzyme
MDLSRLLPAVDVEDLTARLRTVVDPEIGVNVVDLGLVYECDIHAGVAHVLMTTTTPACPIGSFLEDQVRWALLDAPGVVDVEVEITHDPAWSPALMSPAARVALGMPA